MVRSRSSHGRSPRQNWISRRVPTSLVSCAIQVLVAVFFPPGAMARTLRVNTCVDVNSYMIVKYLLHAQACVRGFSARAFHDSASEHNPIPSSAGYSRGRAIGGGIAGGGAGPSWPFGSGSQSTD